MNWESKLAPYPLPSWPLLPSGHKTADTVPVSPRHLEQPDQTDGSRGVYALSQGLVLYQWSPPALRDMQSWALLSTRVQCGALSSHAQQAPTALKQAMARWKTVSSVPQGPSAPGVSPSPCSVHGELPARVRVRGWLWPVCYAPQVTTALSQALPLHCHVVLAASLGPGHLWCQECPGGKLCNQTKLAGPIACPPGHYCPAQGLLSIPCPMGTFREAPGAAHVEDCQLCSPGTFCGRTGLAKPQGLCSPGHHCGPGSNTSSPEGLPFGDLCPAGHFCPAGTKNARQRPCPAGTWNGERGARDVSWCLPCPPGLFCAGKGQTAPRGPCAPGDIIAQEGHGPPDLSVAHGETLALWAVSALKAHWGPHLSQMGSTAMDQQKCPLQRVGKVEIAEGLALGWEGLLCDLTQFRLWAGAGVTHLDRHIHAMAGGPCPPGHFCPVGTEVPLPCPVGTFSDRMFLSMVSECLSCPSGHFCGASGLTAPSGPCSPGYFCLEGVSSPTPAGHSEHGGPCPQGHFCPSGTSHPKPCPAGSYSNLTGQASCFPCPAGYYCPENITTYSRHPCPAGFYCPRGTKYATQFPCPRGYYNPDPLTQTLDSCLPCPPGHYCGQENLTQASGPCDAGWFCISAAWTARPFDLDNYTSTNCLCPATATGGKCPVGSFCPEGSPEPVPCPPGSFCATSGLSTPSGPCQAGYFCAEGAVSPAPEDGLTGAPCPPGNFCPAASHRPTPCPAGTFSSLPGQTMLSACQACPHSFYCKEAGLQAPSGQCPAGYYCDSTAGPVQDFSLYPCPQGYYCPLGTAVATHHRCPVGTYGHQGGLRSITECQLCPAGKFCAQAGLTAPTGDCAAGHWCKGGATSKDPTDGARGLLCPAGHYCLEGELPSPPNAQLVPGLRKGTGPQKDVKIALEVDPALTAPCQHGQHPATQGVSCTRGTVPTSPMEGLSGRPCPPGHFCALGMADPTECPPGSYASGTHTTKCSICPSGHYCVPGLRLQLCPRGFYCPEGTGLDWQPCPPGTYGPTLGLSRLPECQACDRGRFCPRANATEAGGQCWEGFFCSRGSTRPNPEAGTEGQTEGKHLRKFTFRVMEFSPTKPSTRVTWCILFLGWREGQASNQTSEGRAQPRYEEAGPCPQGHYCPRGSAVPQPCPPGTFSAHIKLSSEEEFARYLESVRAEWSRYLSWVLEADCSLCPAGHYCGSAGLTSPSGPCSSGFFCRHGALIPNSSLGDGTSGPCPAGHFCPPGTVTPRPCPAGTYNSLAAQGHCESCPEGFFCPANTSSVVENECPAGHYCPISTASAFQFPCPRGTYKPQRGGVQQSDCTPCEPGSYCLLPGLVAVSGPCRAGFYCTQAAAVPNPTDGITGDLCPPGHFCPEGSPRPIPCPPGSLQPIPGATSREDCQPCPPGWFCSRAGLSFPEAPCEGGWFCPGASVSGHSPGALSAPLGTHAPQAAWNPSSALQGSIRMNLDRVSARHALLESSVPSGARGQESGLPGQWTVLLATTALWVPGPPPNTHVPGAPSESGLVHAVLRIVGLVLQDNSAQIQGSGKTFPDGPCSAGYYCPPGQTSATPTSFRCPHGFYCPEGSPQPRACENGTFQPQEAKGSCEPCPAGFYCEDGGTGPMAGHPSLCLQGYFCPPGSHSATAHPCPRGTFGPKRGASAELDCELCPAGMFCSSEGLSQPSGLCHSAYYCTGGAVSPTPLKHKGWRPQDFLGMTSAPPASSAPREQVPQCHARLGFIPPPQAWPARTSASHAPQGTTAVIRGCPTPCRQGSAMQGPHGCARGGPATVLRFLRYICLGGSAVPSPSDGTHGYRCPPGFRCPPGAHSEQPCEPGTFSPLPGADTCLPCPGGTYCQKAATVKPTTCPKVSSTSFSCILCTPQGHYCPGGTSSALPCPEGTLNPQEGALSPGACQPCPAGRYCPGEGSRQAEGPCSAGYYCEGGAASPTPQGNSAFPLNGPCPRGHYCPKGTLYPVLCPMGTTRNNPDERGPLFHVLQEPSLLKMCQASGKRLTVQSVALVTTAEVDSYGGNVLLVISVLLGPLDCRHKVPRSLSPHVPGDSCAPSSAHQAFTARRAVENPPCAPLTLWRLSPEPSSKRNAGLALPGTGAKPGDPAPRPCPAGHYCPGGNETSTGAPQACPEHTYLAAEGGKSLAECLPCPPGYHCLSPGLSSFKNHPCPPGYWCPGGRGPFLCPPGTFRTKPGATSQEDCELCPPGHYCPQAELRGHPNVFAIPCRAGSECPAGAVAEVTCRAGSYCRPQTGVPPLCPEGYACPAGSSTYSGPGQLAHPRACPGGSEALNKTGLRVSKETCCRLCEAGTYRSQAPDAQACQPCPPGFSCHQGTESYHSQPCPVGHYCPAGTSSPRPCPSGTFRNSSQAGAAGECLPCPAGTFGPQPGQPGCLPCGSSAFSLPDDSASHCTCRGLNRVFQKSDGSCICLAGHESYSRRGLKSEENNSDEDCQPQSSHHVLERCWAGEVRLAATRQCVSPQLHNCSSFCHPVGGELSAELGICQCQEYVSAEELCDAQCLARAPQLSLAWGSSRELILSVKGKVGDSNRREIVSTLGPDQFFQGNARVHLVQCGPHGIFGFIVSRVDMLGSFLLGPPASSPWLQRRHRTTGSEHPVLRDPHIHPHIPNPMVCLVEGDVILFQLHILPHNRSASHYPVYQMQHLFNSNPHWDFGAFRRLSHLVQETHLNLSRFAHQFLDPGTYVFQDNGLPESIMVVLVKKKGAACDPGLSPIQPSSPYQLGRHGVLRHRPPNLGPDWAVITGVLLAIGLATFLLTGLSLLLRPPPAQACPVRTWQPQWRGTGEPHMPTEYVPLRDSLLSYEDLGPRGSGEGADSREKAITQGTGEPLPVKTLEDFSIRTLYNKLEDQNLHVAAQLRKHRSDALAFYRGASLQLQGLKDILQPLCTTEQQALDRSEGPAMEANTGARTDTGQSEESWGHRTAASPRAHWRHPLA
ncbi:hypothetical protein VULLAG_LOCUS22832 [Vulpes lagopus]